jgi:hypothetical protein
LSNRLRNSIPNSWATACHLGWRLARAFLQRVDDRGHGLQAFSFNGMRKVGDNLFEQAGAPFGAITHFVDAF